MSKIIMSNGVTTVNAYILLDICIILIFGTLLWDSKCSVTPKMG